MIDIQPLVVKKLNEVSIPLHYELDTDSSTPTPCITYKENDLSSRKRSDSLSYADVAFDIKVWSRDKRELITYSILAAEKMEELGFNLTFKDEIKIDGLYCRYLRFSAIAYKNKKL